MNTDIENRIRKLFALAGNNPNQAEAAAALAKAQALMTEHHIEQLQITEITEEEIRTMLDDADGLSGAGWKKDLCHMLSRANGCFTYNSGAQIGICGKPSNIKTMSYIFQYCVSQIDALANREAKGLGRAYVNSFKGGCVAAIGLSIKAERERMENEMRATAAASNDCTALVRVNNALAVARNERAVAEAKCRAQVKLSFGKNRRSFGSEAGYRAGQAAGSSIYGSSRNAGAKRIG